MTSSQVVGTTAVLTVLLGVFPVLCTAEWLSPSNPRLRLAGRLPKSTVILRIPVPRQGGREISARTMCNRSVFKGAAAHFSLACMTGALWAKRDERDISRGARHEREARDEEKRKFLFFSSPLRARVTLHAKYRVRPAWLIKRLSYRLISLRRVSHIGWHIHYRMEPFSHPRRTHTHAQWVLNQEPIKLGIFLF